MHVKEIKSLIISIAMLLCTSTFSAVVSDNDGSAFITRAEFDSLKSNFQTQVDSYNYSIGNKIDAAIDSYLAGLNVQNEEQISLFFPVNSATLNKPKMVKNKTNSIKKQTFQGGTFINSLWANYGAPFGLEFMPYTYGNLTQLSLLGNGYFDQMEGWTFDKESPSVLISKYGYDNCNLFLSTTTTMNQNFGYGGTADTWVMGVQPGTFNNKNINTVYTDATGIGNGVGNWACGTRQSWLADNLTDTLVKNNWVDELPIPRDFAERYAKRANSSNYGEDVRAIEYLISHSTNSEDKNVYLYTLCEDVIYAHETDETKLEEYRDYMVDVETADVIGGEATNLYITDKTEKWMWWINWGTDQGQVIGPRRNWRFTPKFKLKNTYSEVAPNTPSISGGTNYWNTLNQFKNGKLKYTDYEGKVQYAHFYSGIPIFTVTNNASRVRFDVRISPTISNTVSNICVQVMSEEFPNGYDMNTWTSHKKNSIKKITGSSVSAGATTNYSYDSTNNYLSIPANTTVTITIDNPDTNKTYFLRWWESGNADYAGGQIDLLENGRILKS